MPRKRWIKLWTQEAIQGTTRREMEPDERSVWWDFLALAGDSPDPGKICFYRNVPLTDDQLCQTLNISQDLLNRARGKMLKFGKITVNEGIIHVVNWERYQSEYERTKKYTKRSVENLQENLQTEQCRKSTKKSTLHQIRPDQNKTEGVNIPFTYVKGFQDLKNEVSKLVNKKDKISFCIDAFRFYHSNASPDDLENSGGRIAGILKLISNDYDYFLKLIWDTSSANIAGSHLSYIQGALRKTHPDISTEFADSGRYKPLGDKNE